MKGSDWWIQSRGYKQTNPPFLGDGTSSEVFVPASEVVRGRALLLLRVVVEVGRVQRRLDL